MSNLVENIRNEHVNKHIKALEETNNFKVLRRVPEYPIVAYPLPGIKFAIIDLETTGLDYKIEGITEIGIIICNTLISGEIEIVNIFSSFNDPHKEISKEITELTGITQDMVRGHQIPWGIVASLLSDTSYILCHNAAFDRKFLEKADLLFCNKQFGCTKNDVNWKIRGLGSDKLDYINWKLGYFYEGHRAINDCWATLNLLIQSKCLEELSNNIQAETGEVYAVDAPFNTKDKLSANGFRWNDGANGKPKAWFKATDCSAGVIQWFYENKISCHPHLIRIDSFKRYSARS